MKIKQLQVTFVTNNAKNQPHLCDRLGKKTLPIFPNKD